MSQTTHSHRNLPLFCFATEIIPLQSRLLMLMASMADRQGICYLRASTCALLLGMDPKDTTERKAGMAVKQIRDARAKLVKAGCLVKLSGDTISDHRYRVVPSPLPASTLETWNALGRKKDIRYTDAPWLPSLTVGEVEQIIPPDAVGTDGGDADLLADLGIE